MPALSRTMTDLRLATGGGSNYEVLFLSATATLLTVLVRQQYSGVLELWTVVP